MKNLSFTVILIILFASCSPQLRVIHPVKAIQGIDFTVFTEKGFLFTPEKYSGSYESIGLINYENSPGATYKTASAFDFGWEVDSISLKDAINEVYQICILMGADALVNFHTEEVVTRYSGIQNPATIKGIRITGFAIKRKVE